MGKIQRYPLDGQFRKSGHLLIILPCCGTNHQIVDHGNDYPLDFKVKPSTPILKVIKAWARKFGLTLDGWV